MHFDLPKEKNSIIKVIGVGGGGSNAVNHMFKQGIKDVDFIVCNTDRQVLDASPVPLKIQLGATLTEGLGAGSMPEMGRKAALENEEEIKKALANTKMLFITAGMGGGTGTGAAPVIARIAREMNILTVSICTLPFSWEGKLRRKQAETGLAELKKYSDSVLVILNDKLREIYHNLKVKEAFAHADNVLTCAARCIAELINVALTINVDFNDVRRVMENSGVAIMGSATASGEGRSLKAVTQALNSPLLNDNDIHGARYVLVSITCGEGKDELTMDELAEITDYIQDASGQTAEMIKGYGTDAKLGDKVSVTIIASGFERNDTDMGFETPLPPQVKMMHLEDKVTPQVKEEEQNGSPSTDGLTQPTLKSEIIGDKKESPAISSAEPSAAEKKKEELLIEIKKIEQQPVEIKPLEAKENKEMKEIGNEDATDSQSTEEDDLHIKPFVIIKEQQQKSFEFELPPVPVPKVAESSPPCAGEGSASISGTENPLPAKQEPTPAVNMEIKRTSVSDGKEENGAPLCESGLAGRTESKPHSEFVSGVTKVSEVTLNSQPPISDSEAKAKAQEKIQKLRELSFKLKTPVGLAELESEPAYKRKNVVLKDTPPSSESEISRFTLGNDESGTQEKTQSKPALRPDNSFLHDKPD